MVKEKGWKNARGSWRYEQYDEKYEEGAETTVVLTGVPKSLNAEILLGLLDEHFNRCYNYFYLPMDLDRFESTGLAYINFTSHESAVECQRFFTGFTAWPGNHRSERTCKAQWSSIQGYEANVEKQQKLQDWVSCNVPEDCKPMVFDENGTRLPTMDVFPPSEDWRDSKGWSEWYGGEGSEWREESWKKDEWQSSSKGWDSWKWGQTWQPDLWKGKEKEWQWQEEAKQVDVLELLPALGSKPSDEEPEGQESHEDEAYAEVPEAQEVQEVLEVAKPKEVVSLGLARYACPSCRSCFAKWSACQHHISSEAKCRKETSELEDLQAACKRQAEELPNEERTFQTAEVAQVRRFQ